MCFGFRDTMGLNTKIGFCLACLCGVITIIVFFQSNKMGTTVRIYPNRDDGAGDELTMGHFQYLPPDLDGTLGKWLLTWQPSIRREFEKLVADDVAMDDPRLINHIRKILIPPSNHRKIKYSMKARETPQIKEVLKIFNKKKKGFYVECGALDGERSSNTFLLETAYGWQGLLVEMDPYFFTQLLGRNRKSYALNACLSPDVKPSYIPFIESSRGEGKLSTSDRGMLIPCFPVYSVLLALNMTEVDFFSLDVEGMELPILKTIPHERVNIKSWTVETAHGKDGKSKMIEYMKNEGYKAVKDLFYVDTHIAFSVNDTIFIKEGMNY